MEAHFLETVPSTHSIEASSYPYSAFNSSKYDEHHSHYIHFNPPKNIEEIVSHPIESGFLRAFCESQYSSENVRFIIEVGRFVDSIKRDSTLCRNTINYKEIDRLTNLNEVDITAVVVPHKGKELDFGKVSDWSSSVVARYTVIEHVAKIFDEYLSVDADSQICLSSNVLANTLHRIKNIHRYTFQIFEEALLDPIKTLRRDVLPRFLQSEHYKRLVSHCSRIYPLPVLKEFTFQMPSTAKNLRNVDWYVLLHDYILFGQFLKYTQSIVSSENLLCARLSAKYMCLWEAKGYPGKQNTFISLNCTGTHTANRSTSVTTRLPDSLNTTVSNATVNEKLLFSNKADHIVKTMKCPPDAQELAWFVFRYFILPNSVYEISLSHRKRKDIMESLANPDYHLFDK
eukprot:gene19099-24929_t